MTGAGDAAELLIAFSAGWLKLHGPHAVSLHGKLREAMRPENLTEGMGTELIGSGN